VTFGDRYDKFLRRVRFGKTDDFHVDQPDSLSGVHHRALGNLSSALRMDDPQRAVLLHRGLQYGETRQLLRVDRAEEDRVAVLRRLADDDFLRGAAEFLEKAGIADGDDRRAPVRLDAELLQPRPVRIIAFSVLSGCPPRLPCLPCPFSHSILS